MQYALLKKTLYIAEGSKRTRSRSPPNLQEKLRKHFGDRKTSLPL
jgi:hypothetical protein